MTKLEAESARDWVLQWFQGLIENELAVLEIPGRLPARFDGINADELDEVVISTASEVASAIGALRRV
jgi:hypothetical protein